jgi:hypothetical protein
VTERGYVGAVEGVGGRCLGRTVSMPGTPRASRPRRKSVDMLKPFPAGVAKPVGFPRSVTSVQACSPNHFLPPPALTHYCLLHECAP